MKDEKDFDKDDMLSKFVYVYGFCLQNCLSKRLYALVCALNLIVEIGY